MYYILNRIIFCEAEACGKLLDSDKHWAAAEKKKNSI